VLKQCQSGRPIVASYFQNVIGWRTFLERDKISTRLIVWGENHDGRFFCKNEAMAQKMFLLLLRSIKGARIGPVVALMKCQKRGHIVKSGGAHCVGTGRVGIGLLRSNGMVQAMQGVGIAKLGIELGQGIQQEKRKAT